MVRQSLMAVTVAGLLLTGAAPAAPPDFPVSFISVDELKGVLDQKARVDIIDVRTRAEYEAPSPCAPCESAPPALRVLASSSSTERAPTRWLGGPATCCTRWAIATNACSMKDSRAGRPRATRWQEPKPRQTGRAERP